MKPSVYVETTVISYIVSRPSRDLIVAAHQQTTRDWWERALPAFDPFISEAVLDEIGRGDPAFAQARIEVSKSFPVLRTEAEAISLGDEYYNLLGIPQRAKADALHLALAVWHGMDFLVTWNCTHLASGRVERIIQDINAKRGMRTPIICTPEEIMEV